MSNYSTTEVAEIIGLKPTQVRHYVRRELLQPRRNERGEYRFTFQDVVMLRTAKGLLDSDVGTRKAYRMLLKLKAELASARSLASLRIFADGNTVVVREDNSVWDVESGQTRLDFTVQELADNVASLASQGGVQNADYSKLGVPELNEAMDTDEWYNLGLDLEEAESEKAPEAYLQAIKLDPRNADAHVNLGRLYQLRGDLKKAKRHYQLAMTAAPGHELAQYNLGTVFDELDETQKAAEHYTNAPNVPDAHYNLARIFELKGDELSALRHMRKYRDLVDG